MTTREIYEHAYRTKRKGFYSSQEVRKAQPVAIRPIWDAAFQSRADFQTRDSLQKPGPRRGKYSKHERSYFGRRAPRYPNRPLSYE